MLRSNFRWTWKAFITSDVFFFLPTLGAAYWFGDQAKWYWADIVGYLEQFHHIPKWIIATPDFPIGIIVFLLIMTVFLTLRTVALNHYLKPRLQCTFDMGNPGCFVRTVVNTQNVISGRTVAASFLARYFRIEVRLDSPKQVVCSGFITSIRHGVLESLTGEKLQLPFAPAVNPDAYEKTVKDKLPEYLDVLRVTDRNDVDICISQSPNSRNLQSITVNHGNHDFTVIITCADSFSQEIKLRFNWQGNWETASMEMLK